jgi:hypothetical protein
VTESDNIPRAARGDVYEVWFLTFTHPASRLGYWIRSSYCSPREGTPSAGLWFARFDPSDPTKTFGLHQTSSSWSVEPNVFDVRIGSSTMSSGRARGGVEGGGHLASWDLEWSTGEPTYRLLPDFMYRGTIAPTKAFSPNVDTRLRGVVTVDGEPSEIADAPGQQGHLFGTRHAERWAWAHCNDLEGGTVVHALAAQGRRGPFRTPFLTFVGVRWQGRWIRFAKVARRPDFGLGAWRLDLRSKRFRLAGMIDTPPESLLRARYHDPDGSVRYCHNAVIASCRLSLFGRSGAGFEQVALLESSGTTHAEWAGRAPAEAVSRGFTDVPA